jgi:hypothetical protein
LAKVHEEPSKCQTKDNSKSVHGPQRAVQQQDKLIVGSKFNFNRSSWFSPMPESIPGINKYKNFTLYMREASNLRQNNIW